MRREKKEVRSDECILVVLFSPQNLRKIYKKNLKKPVLVRYETVPDIRLAVHELPVLAEVGENTARVASASLKNKEERFEHSRSSGKRLKPKGQDKERIKNAAKVW